MATRLTPRTAVLAAVAAALVIAVIVGAFMLGRGTKPVADPTPTDTAPTTTPASPSGSASVSGNGYLEKGAVAAGEGGEPTGPAGLRINYTQTADGAVQAAVNYLSGWATPEALKSEATMKAVVDQVSIDDPALRASLLDEIDLVRKNREVVAPSSFEEGVAFYRAGAYAVSSADPNPESPERVDVMLWAGVGETWTIERVRLVWSDGDWKLRADTDISTAYRAPKGAPPSAAEKFDILKNPPTQGAEEAGFEGAYTLGWQEFSNATR